ncbi:hypothetical protein BD410DRAFT_797274 [Rickenella mellea]|uniref:Uncharacterized protein n=1 Tax=Rickenella mellea TaxID=50990 RepID=A0A4Y7PGV2_9AGAM|nr:hypothetical protein BD410DRAFT_797274 [Rickenella mellea]
MNFKWRANGLVRAARPTSPVHNIPCTPEQPDTSVERTEQLSTCQNGARQETPNEGVVQVTREGLARKPEVLNAPEHRAPESQEQPTLRSTHMQGRVPLHKTICHRSGYNATRATQRRRRGSSPS